MLHRGTVSIETIRLILRKFEVTDAKDMYHNWASDPEVCKFLSWGPHGNIEISKQRVKQWAEDTRINNYNWAIYLKRVDQVIGSITAVNSDERSKSCEIGYCIGKEYWGEGIVTEALRAVMHFLFYEVGYQRIEARHDVENIASGRVMQKAGMHQDKIVRNGNLRRDGIYYDIVVYSKAFDEL